MSAPMVRVFLSSTWLDLQPERAAVEAVIHRLHETKFNGMEYFGSRDETTQRASLEEVDRSQVYVGLFGGRYGSGVTEDEYRRARERELPCFIYLKARETIPSQWQDTDPAPAAKLAALKQDLLRDHTISEFRNPDELATKVATDLHRWLVEEFLEPKLAQGARGEVPRRETDQLLAAIQDLGTINQQLLTKLLHRGFVMAKGERSVAAETITDSIVVPGDGNQITRIGTVATLTIQSAVFQAAPEPGTVPPKELLWTYLNQVVRDTAFLDLSGVDRKAATDNQDTRLQLAAIYTELDTLGREMPERLGRAARREEPMVEQGKRESVTAFASRTPCAVLLGDPGSGKTTFANFLALALAGELLGDATANLKLLGEGWQAGSWLPLRVVLRDFAAQAQNDRRLSPGEQLLQHFSRRLGEGLAPFGPLLRKHLLEQGGLLILDGLDEVPEANHRRELVKQAVLDLQRVYPRLRFLLTSRTYAYQRQQWRLPGFTEAVLAPFTDEQVKTFIVHWYDHVRTVRRKLTPEEARGRATLLQQAIAQNPTLRELARRPLLLTLMASLHAWRGGTLPDQREELYDESVNLLLDFWEKPKVVLGEDGQPVLQTESAAEWFSAPRQRIREAIEEVAFQAHRDQPSRTGAADIRETDLAAALLKIAEPDMKQARVLEYIRDRAGLLLHRAEGIYSFPHRTFQEYLAARHLTLAGFPDQLVDLARHDTERWREVVLLAGAKAARGAPHSAWSLVAALCPEACNPQRLREATDRDWWLAMLAGQVLNETDIARTAGANRANQHCLTHVREWLMELLDGGHLPPVDRAAAGAVLGRLGDRRKGVGLTDDGLPDIDWIEVEAGPFTMGSTKDEGYSSERPQFQCALLTQPYRIARYPVTVTQYQAFVDAGGYSQPQWWAEAMAAGYWEDGRLKSRFWDGDNWRDEVRSAPGDSGEAFRLRNSPVVDVSWFEASAFCRWLAKQTGLNITLPSEAQWERAARHTDKRVYPWGSSSADVPKCCNMDETGIGHPSAVGMFPGGRAECGAMDMAGNVWEWCRTNWLKDYQDYERRATDDLAGSEPRVLRGGAFDVARDRVRCASRVRPIPDYRHTYCGFRVVVSPF